MNKLILFPSNLPTYFQCGFQINLNEVISDLLESVSLDGSEIRTELTGLVAYEKFQHNLESITRASLSNQYEIVISPLKINIVPERFYQKPRVSNLEEYKNDLTHFVSSKSGGVLKQYLAIEGELSHKVKAFVYIQLNYTKPTLVLT